METQSSIVQNPLDLLAGRKVLIDARKLLGGGIGIYLNNLISGLSDFTKAEITLITDDSSKINPNWRVSFIENKTKLNSLEELFTLGSKIDFSKFDLFHTPYHVLPYGIKIPTVVTIHDTIHITNPEKFFYPYLARTLIRSSIKRASRIITVSKHSKSELTDLYPKYAEKIDVIRNSLPVEFLVTEKENCKLVNGKYVLAVFSNLKPHKGLNDLLSSFCEIDSSYQLVLVGQGIEQLVDDHSMLNKACSSKVKLLGRVDTHELVSLYSNAKGIIISSLAEGFCFPIIEAHSRNKPVVMRPVPACMELACPDDIICKDFSINAFKQGIEELINSKKENLDLSSSVNEFNNFSVTKEIAKSYLKVLK